MAIRASFALSKKFFPDLQDLKFLFTVNLTNLHNKRLSRQIHGVLGRNMTLKISRISNFIPPRYNVLYGHLLYTVLSKVVAP